MSEKLPLNISPNPLEVVPKENPFWDKSMLTGKKRKKNYPTK
jgi:hypothetical protein